VFNGSSADFGYRLISGLQPAQAVYITCRCSIEVENKIAAAGLVFLTTAADIKMSFQTLLSQR